MPPITVRSSRRRRGPPAKSRQYDGIPGVGEEISGRAQTAIGDEFVVFDSELSRVR